MSVSERLWYQYLEYHMYNKCLSPALDVNCSIDVNDIFRVK
jgi:hypothetical protein